MKRPLLCVLAIVIFPALVFAGTKGKVAGTVTDTETGRPLPVANVIIEGTTMGAAANRDGQYVILNVPPGMYTVKASMMGYAAHTVTEVHVHIDRTTTVNFNMQPTVLTGQEVVVVAKRPVIQEDVAATQKVVTSDQIEALPAASVKGVMVVQPGIEVGQEGIYVRGSGQDEAIFMVDGVVLRDQRTNEPITSVPLSAIQEIAVQTGGFSPEYHNVRSGVVNVVTKEGSPNRYAATISFKIRPAGPKHFGISPYDPNSCWLRPYLDDEVCWEGTKSGAWDVYRQRQYIEFDGWNSVSEQLLADDDPTNDLTPEACQRIFMWEHRKQGDIKKPDYNIDLGFGGPVPFVGKSLGNLRFYSSFRREQDMYLIQLSRDAITDQSGMLKLTSDMAPSMKLSFLGLYGETFATSRSRSGGTDYMNGTWEVADATDRAGFTVPWRLYTNIYWCPTDRFYQTLSAKFTHLLSSTTFYELQLKQIGKRYVTGPPRDRDTAKVYEPIPGYVVDEAPEGFWADYLFGIDGMAMGGPIATARDSSRFTTITAKFDLVSQINHNNQIKTGLEFAFDNFDMKFGMENKPLPEGNTWTEFEQNPYRIIHYLQDKLEFQGFISTLGLVTEYSDPNGYWYSVDEMEKAFYNRDFFSQSYTPAIEDTIPTEKAKAQLTFSPRLAVSHPITENSKLYFNYGHYRQMPTSDRLYRVQRALNNKVDYFGDPTIPLAKTISYELGYDHALFKDLLFHLAAYYKDISDQQDWTRYISFDGKVNYWKLTSNSYEDIRGLEVDLTKLWGKWFTGNINYEYRVNTSGYFGVGEYYENPAEQREYLRDNPYQTKPIPQPRFKAYLDFHTPPDLGPDLAGIRPLGGWLLNFVARWTTGSWFTWNPNNVRGIEYNVQWKDYYNVNLKVSKTLQLGSVDLKFFMDIYNLLNTKHFSGVSFIDSYDYNYYMKSLHLTEGVADPLGEYGNIPGNDNPGDYRKDGVDFQPIEWVSDISSITNPDTIPIYYDAETQKYMEYSNGKWDEVGSSRMQRILDTKAYIDMPNHTFFTFLNPRSIFFGFTINYRF